MAEYIFSIGAKAGGNDLVRISSVAGSSPSYTLTLAASVPATVRKGDKIVDSNSKTYLITGPTAGGATDRTITPGTSLTVDKTPLSIAPFNSTVDPTANAGVDCNISRAFSKPNVSGATDGTTGSWERGTRQAALNNAYTGEVWESTTQNTNLGIFSAGSPSASNFRKLTNAPGFRLKDQSGIASQAIKLGTLSLPTVTVTSVGSSGWVKPVENYSQMQDLMIDLQAVSATDYAIYTDAGGTGNAFHDNIVAVAFSGTNRSLVVLTTGALNFYKNFVYVYSMTGSQAVIINANVAGNNIHENTFLVCQDVSGSPQFLNGVDLNSLANQSVTNNVFLAVIAATAAFKNTGGAGTVVDYNTYAATANDADHTGTHFKRIDNSTAGQLISDLLKGVTSSTVDGRPQNNTNIAASGDGATGTTNTTDLIGQTYVSGTGRATGAIEYALPGMGAIHQYLRRWRD